MKHNLNFEVTPLDVNIAKMIFELRNELDAHKGQADGCRFEHIFESLSYILDLSTLSIVCNCDPQIDGDAPAFLEVTARSKDGKKENRMSFRFSSIQKAFDFVDNRSFLSLCKRTVFELEKISPDA